MRSQGFALVVALCVVPIGLPAQSSISSFSPISSESLQDDTGNQAGPRTKAPQPTIKPLSHIALGGGFSPLGVNVFVATNLNKHLNLRGTGNVFQYTANNISTNGFNVDAKFNFASAGASIDLYPFANHGFRLSPGALFYNNNAADAIFAVKGGTSFTLNGVTYYASSTSPVQGTGSLGLHTQNPAFTITTGWGNAIPRKGGHWSFPVELGVAFTGAPALNIALTQGQVCDFSGLNCVNVATDQSVQTNLQAQVAKYKKDLDPLKTYPIVGFGVAYSFPIR